MKKKLFALLLVLCLLLTACSAAPVQESAEPTAAPEETAAEETQPEETTAPEEDSVFIVGTTAEILTANRSEYNFDVISGTLSQLAPSGWMKTAITSRCSATMRRRTARPGRSPCARA